MEQRQSDYPPSYMDAVSTQPMRKEEIPQVAMMQPNQPGPGTFPQQYNTQMQWPYSQQYNAQMPRSYPQQNPVNPHMPSAPGFVPTYGAVTIAPPPATTHVTTEIIMVNGCPCCRIGVLDDNYPCLAICCAILFFPVGVLCCLCMKNKKCSNCGAEF